MFSHESQVTTAVGAARLGRRAFAALAGLGSGAQFISIRLARRWEWITHGLTLDKSLNLASALAHFGARSARSARYPVFVVIDITPLCNLHCTVCVHAHPAGNPALAKQRFRAGQVMDVEHYRRIIDEIKRHTLGVELYYLGEPLMHPRLAELCHISAAAHLNTHVSTSFSFRLSDEQIRALVTSGLTHLTVCVDGLSQSRYGWTRVGGRLDWVLSNLERTCACRRRLGRRYPRIEVQYFKFQHNVDELAGARRLFQRLGVDQVHEAWGWLHNYTDRDPGRFDAFGPRRDRWLPVCHWPHLFTLIKYDGDVIPCCAYRLGEQYAAGVDPRVVGNVFAGGLRGIWDSAAYRQLRRWAARPSLVEQEPELRTTFCDGCPRLFETNYTERTCRFGDQYRFEDLYTLDADGRPLRRLDS